MNLQSSNMNSEVLITEVVFHTKAICKVLEVIKIMVTIVVNLFFLLKF